MNLNRIESNGQLFILTIGLSLVSLMLIGFLMNLLYPFLGINKPLSPPSILVTINLLILFTCLILYLLDRGHVDQVSDTLKDTVKTPATYSCDLKKLVTPTFLLPFLLPILSILGAFAMNVYDFNGFTILMILFMGILTLLVSVGWFPTKFYPLIILLFSISLLLHKSLISSYIWGWDINYEYFLANQVISNSIWNENLPVSYNSMLSLMILAPILNSFINCGLVWIMKVVYPFIFSLVPVGLYYVFREQTRPKIAFLSVFFFIIQFTFYTEMLALLRQQVAELMLVLVLMVTITTPISTRNRSLLLVIFGMSIIVAHYGLASIMMIIFMISLLLIYLSENGPLDWFKNSWLRLAQHSKVISIVLFCSGHFLGTNEAQKIRYPLKPRVREKIEKYRAMEKRGVITSSFIGLLILFLLTWYIYTSNSTIFESLVDIVRNIAENIYSFMDPNTTQGLNLLMAEQSTPLRSLHKYLYLSSQFFIGIGVVSLLLGKYGMNFNREYKAISLATFFVLVGGVMVPFFSSQMNTTRLYHVALIILAPYCVLGIFTLFKLLKRFFTLNFTRDGILKVISVYFILLLLFDTGLVYEFLDKEHPTSIALNSSYDFPKFNPYEVSGANWLRDNSNQQTIYADKYRATVLGSMVVCKEIPPYFDLLTGQSLVFLGTKNLESGKILVYTMVGSNIVQQESYVSAQEILRSRFKVYDNGGSNIYSQVNPTGLT